MKLLELQFAEDKYSDSLTIQTESPQAETFQIGQIRSQIQYKDNRKLCDVTVSKIIKRLGEPFYYRSAETGAFGLLWEQGRS